MVIVLIRERDKAVRRCDNLAAELSLIQETLVLVRCLYCVLFLPFAHLVDLLKSFLYWNKVLIMALSWTFHRLYYPQNYIYKTTGNLNEFRKFSSLQREEEKRTMEVNIDLLEKELDTTFQENSELKTEVIDLEVTYTRPSF